jgi:peptidoglycan hydrolase-like protein with peptidoglycan-binding domain
VLRFEIGVINQLINQIKTMKTKIFNIKFLTLSVLALPIFLGLSGVSKAYTQITTQLDPGARGSNVTNLQAFFADNSSIYPEGLVTGYYGNLTTTAVNRFQAAYGFSQVGRVGPMTLSKINSLIVNGGWGDNLAPIMYSSTVNTGNNSATFSWSVNENSSARVFYDTKPVTIDEGDINSVGFRVVSGSAASDDSVVRTSQQVVITGLQANTTYYYMLVSKDTNGNVSVSNVNNTFKTTN